MGWPDEVIMLYRAYDANFYYEPWDIGSLNAKCSLASFSGDRPIDEFRYPLSPFHPPSTVREKPAIQAGPMSSDDIDAAFAKFGVRS